MPADIAPPGYGVQGGANGVLARQIMEDIQRDCSAGRSDLAARRRLHQGLNTLKGLLEDPSDHHLQPPQNPNDPNFEQQRARNNAAGLSVRELILTQLIDHIPASASKEIREKVVRIYQRALHPESLPPKYTRLRLPANGEQRPAARFQVRAFINDIPLVHLLPKLISGGLHDQRSRFLDMAMYLRPLFNLDAAALLHFLERLAPAIDAATAWKLDDQRRFMELIRDALGNALAMKNDGTALADTGADPLYNIVHDVFDRLGSVQGFEDHINTLIDVARDNLATMPGRTPWTHVNLLAVLATLNPNAHGRLHRHMVGLINDELGLLAQHIAANPNPAQPDFRELRPCAAWLVGQLFSTESSVATGVRQHWTGNLEDLAARLQAGHQF